MSDEQDLGRDNTTTQGPPPSYGRRVNSSIIASSQLSPKSPAPSRRTVLTERGSWDEPGTERIDSKRRSTVTFGGKTSVAPDDSISKAQFRPSRASTGFSASGTQYSDRSRRRSAPWQHHDYRSTFPSKAGSSRGGTAWSGDPLTETNLEEFNERRPPRSEAVMTRDVERNVSFEELDRKTNRQSRRDSGVATQDPPYTRAGWIGADDDRRTSKATTRVERDDGYGDRSLVTTRRKTEVDKYGPGEEVASRPKLKPRFPSYSQPTQSSQSKVSTKRQSRGAAVYEQSSQRQSSFSSSRQTQRQTLAGTRRSRPPTMPPEDSYSTRSSRPGGSAVAGAAGVAAGAAIATDVGSRWSGKSKATTKALEESNETQARQTEARSERYSSRPSQVQTRQTEVDKSERYSQREVETERQTTAQQTQASGTVARSSQAPSRPAQPQSTTVVRRAASPSSSPSSPTSASAPAPPSGPDDTQWERRLHIITTRKPDGRLVQDQEYSMRRIWPQQPVGA